MLRLIVAGGGHGHWGPPGAIMGPVAVSSSPPLPLAALPRHGARLEVPGDAEVLDRQRERRTDGGGGGGEQRVRRADSQPTNAVWPGHPEWTGRNDPSCQATSLSVHT